MKLERQSRNIKIIVFRSVECSPVTVEEGEGPDDTSRVSDQQGTEVEENPSLDFVSEADFGAVDVNAVTANIRRTDKRAIEKHLIEMATSADGAGDAVTLRVCRLLLTLLGFHLRVESEGDPFGLQWQNHERRTPLPFDFRGAQKDVLALVANTFAHPTLRARVADVAYESGARHGGKVAIEAYCEVVSRVIEGRAEPEFSELPFTATEIVKPLERSFMINARIAKRGTVLDELEVSVKSAYEFAVRERAYFPFSQLAARILQYDIIPSEDVARTAEELASSANESDYCLAVKEVWNLASDAHRRAGDQEASRVAAIKAIEQTLKMVDAVSQNSAKAHWVKQALREFRARGDTADRVADLRKRLRQFQDSALDEFGQFETPLEGLAEQRVATTAEFERLDLPTAFRAILSYLVPIDPEKLKSDALEMARRYPLSNLFGTSYSDAEGREVARGHSLSLDEAPSEPWFKEHILRHREIFRHYTVHGSIEPARQAVLSRHSVYEQHLLAIVQLSPFVPLGHHHIFASGFARLWQGDYVTAGHLLIPQLENSLRHVLQSAGRDSSKMEESGLEGDRPLNVLLTHCRADLEAIFGPAMVWEIDSLFNFRPGPALRHEVAHGKLPWNGFYSVSAVCGCWLIYLLALLPLMRVWESEVVAAIRAVSEG